MIYTCYLVPLNCVHIENVTKYSRDIFCLGSHAKHKGMLEPGLMFESRLDQGGISGRAGLGCKVDAQLIRNDKQNVCCTIT